jgi:hypothetical protein
LNIENLVLRIIKSLVDNTNEVQVRSLRTEMDTTFEVTVAPTDLGKVIGKQGRTARAIRELLIGFGSAARRRYGLDIFAANGNEGQ